MFCLHILFVYYIGVCLVSEEARSSGTRVTYAAPLPHYLIPLMPQRFWPSTLSIPSHILISCNSPNPGLGGSHPKLFLLLERLCFRNVNKRLNVSVIQVSSTSPLPEKLLSVSSLAKDLNII